MMENDEKIAEIPPRPPQRLKPLKMPRQAWGEESQVGSAQVAGTEQLLSPPPQPGTRVAQPGESVSIERTPESSNVEDFKEALDDLSSDARSSSIGSGSSKKTSTSADFTAQIRKKIRQQAKSMVQKKRGSVQLAKRLLRSQTLETFPEQEVDLGNQEFIDEQLEKSIKEGKRFSLTGKTGEAPTTVQKVFFETESDEKRADDGKPTTVFFARKLTTSQKDLDKFKSMLTTFGRKKLENQVEAPFDVLQTVFSAASQRDFSVFLQREGSNFENAKDAIDKLRTIVTDRPLRQDRESLEDDGGLTEYQKAVNWSDWDVHVKQNAEYYTMDLDLNRIEFEHHWLFTTEDKLAKQVKNLHHEIIQIGSKILETAQELLAFQETMEIKVLTESQKLDSLKKLKELERELDSSKNEYKKLSEELGKAWENLKNERSRVKNPNTKFVVKEIKLPEIHEQWQQFFEDLPFFFIENLDERKPLKNKIQVLIFFNEILVCKTLAVPLQSDFSVQFGKVYQLRIYEPPNEIFLMIREFQPVKGWVEISRVFLPLPSSVEDQHSDLEQAEFASEIVVEKTAKYLGCGMANKESPHLNGKVFYNLKWKEKVGQTNQKVPSRRKKEEDVDLPFQLIPPELRLVSDEEFASDARLDALTKRFARSSVFRRENRRIEINASEMDNSWMIEENRENEALTGLEFSMDSVRKLGNKHAMMIRNQLLETFVQDRKMKTLNDIVREIELPSNFTGFGDIFGPVDLSRRLKPMRTTAQKVQSATTYLKLIVNIQSAANLPERVDKGLMHVLVEAEFQGNKSQTLTVSGKNANWQQTLTLNIEMPSNGQLDLRTVVDHLELNIYDQQIRKLPHDNREPNTVHEQLEKRWLGTCSIPFSTIYSFGKVNGVVAIKEPLFSNEYKLFKHRAFLKVMITLDPPIIPPNFSNYDNFLPYESSEILTECQRFMTKNSQLFPDRRFVCLVNDTSGKRLLATRFLRKILPPQHVHEMLSNSGNIRAAIQLAAHMVSCIPFVADPVMFPGVCDLWTTAEQLLAIGSGDEEEHAILLVCWLMFLNVSAVLILGHGLPEGSKAAYILVQTESDSFLVNPSDGNVYSLNDSMCPLISVGTIITQNNCYANIQKNQHPSTMDFDLNNKSNWDPLFSTTRTDLISVQPEVLTYTGVNEDFLVELRSNLEREIKLKFDEARSYAIPQWNLMASRVLREILIEYDSARIIDLDIEQRLGTVLSSYSVNVVGFRCPYETRQHLVQRVLKTNFHINSNKNMQFALSVHIQPFINNIISCSVAIASLLPKYA